MGWDQLTIVIQLLINNCYTYRYQDDLLVAQQNIQSLQERVLELESQQDRQQGNLTHIFM